MQDDINVCNVVVMSAWYSAAYRKTITVYNYSNITIVLSAF